MRRLNAIGSGQSEGPGKSLAIPVDQLGIWTSTLCVIHCLVTPIVLSISAVSAQFLPSEGGHIALSQWSLPLSARLLQSGVIAATVRCVCC